MNPVKLVSMMLLVAAISGCVTSNSEPAATNQAPDSTDDEGPSDPPANTTTETQEVRRSIDLQADVSEGGAPMTVTFTGYVSADVVADDGEAFPVEPGEYTWTISFGEAADAVTGDESVAAITGNHTYEQVGEFDAVFTVTFGDGEILTHEVTIMVVEGAPQGKPSGAYVKEEPFEASGILATGFDGPDGCGTGNPDTDGITETWIDWEITAEEPDGTRTIVNRLGVQMDYSPPGGDLDLYFLDPEGNVLAEATSFNALTQEWSEAFALEQPLQPGTYQLYVVACIAAATSYTVTGLANYVVA